MSACLSAHGHILILLACLKVSTLNQLPSTVPSEFRMDELMLMALVQTSEKSLRSYKACNQLNPEKMVPHCHSRHSL